MSIGAILAALAGGSRTSERGPPGRHAEGRALGTQQERGTDRFCRLLPSNFNEPFLA